MGSNNAIVGCCAKCDLEIMRDSYEHDHCLIREVEGEKDTFYCQHCGEPEEEEPKWRDGMCWTCCEKPGTHSTFRDALGEDELTCDKCHREEYPEQYEEEQVLGPEHDICCKCGKFKDTGNVCDCGVSHRELCDECKEAENKS